MAVDQDLARTLLTDATARYESACRWATIACFSIFVFHVLTFGPFVQAQIERAAVTAQSKMLNDVSKEVAATLEAQQTAITQIRAELDVMLKSKKADFRLLQRAVELTRQRSGTGSSVSAGPADAPGGRILPQEPMVQMSMSAVQGHRARSDDSARIQRFAKLIVTEELSGAVRDARSGRQLRTILRPIVEQHVIAPRFEAVDQNWQTMRPDLLEKADRAKARFADMAKVFPDTPLWKTLSTEVDHYIAALQKVTFAPPDNPKWWHTVVGKDEAVVQMKNVAVELMSPPSFRTASEALQKLLRDRKELVASLDAKLQDLQRRFEEQQDRLSDLITPIKGVALDLSVVVSNFPLILAILLGGVTIWPTRRYGELSSAATLARRAELLDEPAVDALLRLRDGTRLVIVALGLVALFSAWIVAAAWQLAAWTGRDGLSLTVMTATGILIVFASGLYKAHIMRAAARSH